MYRFHPIPLLLFHSAGGLQKLQLAEDQAGTRKYRLWGFDGEDGGRVASETLFVWWSLIGILRSATSRRVHVIHAVDSSVGVMRHY